MYPLQEKYSYYTDNRSLTVCRAFTLIYKETYTLFKYLLNTTLSEILYNEMIIIISLISIF